MVLSNLNASSVIDVSKTWNLLITSRAKQSIDVPRIPTDVQFSLTNSTEAGIWIAQGGAANTPG
jgi:hypothetical protein